MPGAADTDRPGAGRGGPSARWPVAGVVAALGLVLLAVGVRLINLDSDPLWFDEAATIGIARMDWSTIFGAMAQAESSPPGFYVLAKLWIALFGEDIWSLRLLTVLAGVAALVPVALLARAAGGVRAAWMAVAFFALAATAVRFSQDARVYAVLLLATGWAALAALALIAAVRANRPTLWRALAFGILLGAMLWLHPTAAIIGASLNIMVLAGLGLRWSVLRPGVLWLVLANVLAIAVAAGPLLAMLHHVTGAPRFADRWILPPGLFDVAILYGRTLVGAFLGPLAAITGLVQVALLFVVARAWWRDRDPVLAALAAFLVGGGLLLPLVSQIVPVMLDRTALFLLIPLTVLVAAGAARLPARLFAPVVGILLLLQVVGLAGWHTWPNRKERWDLAANFLQTRMRPGESIVLPDSAFVTISLASHLGAIGAAVPRMAVVPPASDLEQIAAKRLTPGAILPPDSLCAELTGTGGDIWVVMRDHPDSVAGDRGFSTRVAVRAAFSAAGGTLAERTEIVGVVIEQWHLPHC